ncbi:hypothetical protein AL486_19115 [Pandoraea apista]|uniref:hypothetical protein n=1 Tax=Pandoraea apista TaxID=93218 RepID=UPI000CE9AB69|nr:hypothetical protein [Pandoraea apista]AVF41566.1 hypothetical protein AL486_19115 [Pandoraea apista]
MTDQELQVLCLQYGQWCRTRRLFAPPVPSNILARFQPRECAAVEPDAQLIADMPFFNMAVHALANDYPQEGICFSLYHVHGFRPVKTLAASLGIGRRTFYERVRKFSERALKLSVSIRKIHERNAEP